MIRNVLGRSKLNHIRCNLSAHNKYFHSLMLSQALNDDRDLILKTTPNCLASKAYYSRFDKSNKGLFGDKKKKKITEDQLDTMQEDLMEESIDSSQEKMFRELSNGPGFPLEKHDAWMATELRKKMGKTSLEDKYKYAKRESENHNPIFVVEPTSVFANNELDLSEIDVYGFDCDYTLIQYKESVLKMIYDLAKGYLVHKCKYPKELILLNYLPDFAVRGLHYDFKEGLLMKIDSYHQIQLGSVYRGLTPLSKEKILEIYKSETLPQSMFYGDNSQLVQLNDLFSVPEILLLSHITQHFEEKKIPYHPQILFQDVKHAVSNIHPYMHEQVTNDKKIGDYLITNPAVKELLEKLKKAGKKIFLVTNSPFSFVNPGMKYLLGPSWQDLFDLIVVEARKPDFFKATSRPFRIYDQDLDQDRWEKVFRFDKGKIYMEGNVNSLHELTGWQGSRVLYFGDHVYSDLMDVTLREGWKTGAIVSELNKEIEILNNPDCHKKVNWLHMLQVLIEELQRDERDTKAQEFIKSKLKPEREHLRLKLKHTFNKQFGSMFRTFNGPTYFCRRLLRFSDIYTSCISNLVQYSTNHVFYPARGALPHELGTPLLKHLIKDIDDLKYGPEQMPFSQFAKLFRLNEPEYVGDPFDEKPDPEKVRRLQQLDKNFVKIKERMDKKIESIEAPYQTKKK